MSKSFSDVVLGRGGQAYDTGEKPSVLAKK
jgi:hypothetical protein